MVTKVHLIECDDRYGALVDRRLIMPRNKSTPPRKPSNMANIMSPPVASGAEVQALIVKALEDGRYQWRTLGALVRTSGLHEGDVLNVLKSMCDQVVRATTADGRAVYTTRKHYQETHGFGDRLLSALADKVVA